MKIFMILFESFEIAKSAAMQCIYIYIYIYIYLYQFIGVL